MQEQPNALVYLLRNREASARFARKFGHTKVSHGHCRGLILHDAIELGLPSFGGKSCVSALFDRIHPMSFKEHNQASLSLATLERGGHDFAVALRTFLFFTSLASVVFVFPWGGETAMAGDDGLPTICRPALGASRAIELGKAGVFEWTCRGGEKDGRGFYIVFIRPVGTYVLLKVPHGRASFEFTPDMAGMWRWIVINTDPDRSRPDLESEPGYFEVIQTEEP